MKTLIEYKEYAAIRQLLANNPHLSNESITIPYDDKSVLKAHPLHRICDAVFSKHISDEEALEIAKIFLQFGADVNGSVIKGNEDTPLLAAASLHAEQTGIYYIENGADIYYADRNDGATALHWAAFCGRDKLVAKLIQQKAIVDLRDKTYNGTPLMWALHSLKSGDEFNKHRQFACIKLLLQAGADINFLNIEAKEYLNTLFN